MTSLADDLKPGQQVVFTIDRAIYKEDRSTIFNWWDKMTHSSKYLESTQRSTDVGMRIFKQYLTEVTIATLPSNVFM